RNSQAKRSKSAHKLTAFILSDPNSILSMSIATLAGAVGVSEPTVNRFCTGLGLKGFPDFKLSLAAALARTQPSITRDIESGDSISHVAAKVFESTQASLSATQNNIDTAAIEKVVNIFARSRCIVLCGLGASSSVALDAQHKLLRFETPVIAHTDLINQRMTAAGLAPGDCLVCISYTGRTGAMVEVSALGKEAGATIIGITTANSPLAAVCDVTLAVEASEDTELYTPMTSRIAQLVLIDVLATCLALKKGPEFSAHLAKLKRSLKSTRKEK
ncbi:MAG: RpiR family carbohydrate utilization transcriptional regulator, partial [Halioglobus sp.]